MKFETVPCKLDLSFKRQGRPEIGKGLSFVHRGPLGGYCADRTAEKPSSLAERRA